MIIEKYSSAHDLCLRSQRRSLKETFSAAEFSAEFYLICCVTINTYLCIKMLKICAFTAVVLGWLMQ